MVLATPLFLYKCNRWRGVRLRGHRFDSAQCHLRSHFLRSFAIDDDSADSATRWLNRLATSWALGWLCRLAPTGPLFAGFGKVSVRRLREAQAGSARWHHATRLDSADSTSSHRKAHHPFFTASATDGEAPDSRTPPPRRSAICRTGQDFGPPAQSRRWTILCALPVRAWHGHDHCSAPILS